MSALVRSLRLGSTQIAVLTLALVACATAQDPDVDSDGTGNRPSVSGGSSGSSGAASGGASSNVPLAGTSPLPTAGTGVGSGGKPSTGGSSSGGVPATGGSGTAPTAGTTSTSTCPQYAGTLAKDSVIFTGGFGKSTTGAWGGYGYTYKYGTATITPGSGQGCFSMAKFCASGSIPADDASGAGLGWNISQPQGSSTTMKVPVTTPVTVSVAGLPAGARVQLSASSTVSYCYTLTATDIASTTGVTIPYASFKKDCWDTEAAVAYDGATPIEAIQVVVPGAMAAAKTFDFCVLDIEPG